MEDETARGPEPESIEVSPWASRDDELASFLAAARREATAEGRLATVSLTLLPVILGVLLVTIDDGAAASLRTPAGALLLVVAIVLTSLGAVWLWRLAVPPFAVWPKRRSIFERQPQIGYELSVILDRAARFAEDGVGVADALERAAPDQETHPARLVAMALRRGLEPDADPTASIDEPTDDRDIDDRMAEQRVPETEEPATSDMSGSDLHDRLIADLHPARTDKDPVDTLRLIAVRIRSELEASARAWPARVRFRALVPFATCILPATGALVLLAVL